MLMTLNELCQVTGSNKETILAWEKAGKIHSLNTPGNHKRYQSEEYFILRNHIDSLGLRPLLKLYFNSNVFTLTTENIHTLWDFFVEKPFPQVNPKALYNCNAIQVGAITYYQNINNNTYTKLNKTLQKAIKLKYLI